MRPDRGKIITDDLNFPSDLYIMQGCVAQMGNRHRLHTVSCRDGIGVDLQDIYDAIDDDTALVSLSHVAYKSAFLYDARAVTTKAHDAGALMLWDLSHSVGAVPAALDAWDVDFAVGCTYKYLNGGPGAPAFLYVNRRLQDEAISPIWGWFGQKSPFAFDPDYTPVEGIKRFLVGTPPILSLSAMEAAVDIVLDAGIDRIRDKSIRLTEYLIFLFDEILAPRGFSLGSPRDAHQRGSHVSIRHEEAYRINRALIEEMNVIPDFREPDIIRLGLSPLYTSFADVWGIIDRIRIVIDEGHHLKYPHSRPQVT
jgi:kynureninase